MLPNRPRVLLADDHAELAKAVSRVLVLDCDVVGSVSDGGAVLDAAQRLQPDVIVLDLNLHNVNGLEVCRQITHSNSQSKIIVFTAMDEPDLRQRCFEAAPAMTPAIRRTLRNTGGTIESNLRKAARTT